MADADGEHVETAGDADAEQAADEGEVWLHGAQTQAEAGAAELRDWTVAAWAESATASVGWPAVKVAEVEAGTADPWIAMVGED